MLMRWSSILDARWSGITLASAQQPEVVLESLGPVFFCCQLRSPVETRFVSRTLASKLVVDEKSSTRWYWRLEQQCI